MLTEREVAAHCAAWAREIIPALEADYDWPTATKLGALPDVVAEVTGKSLVREDRDFPIQIGGYNLRVFTVELSFMVGLDEENEDAHKAAHYALMDFGKLAEEGIADATLGGRLPTDPLAVASPFFSIDYSQPYVSWPDGTRGRGAPFSMKVAELVSENA